MRAVDHTGPQHGARASPGSREKAQTSSISLLCLPPVVEGMLGPQALGWEEVLWPVLAGLGEVGEGNCGHHWKLVPASLPG